MIWYWGVFIVCIIIVVFISSKGKKKRQKRKDYLIRNWGKTKNDTEFYFDSIEKYYRNTDQSENAFHIISDKCASDLDLNEVFKVIDRTSSKIGQQFLYYKLRTIEHQSSISPFKNLSLLFDKNDQLRLEVQLELDQLNSDNAYHFEDLVNSTPIEPPKLLWLVYTLTLLSIVSILLGFINPLFGLFLIPIVTTNMIFHYKNKWTISRYLDGVGQLTKALKVAKTLIKVADIKEQFSDTTFIKEVEKIKLKTDFISFEKNLTNEFAAGIWVMAELIKVVFNLEYLIFYSFIDSITAKRNELKQLFHFIGEIDVAISISSLKASNYLTCKPKFIENKELITKGIYHPLVENCVINDLQLIDSSLLLTGSNMSGKTTFIRSISINSILAQTLNICFAKEYTAPYFKLYSSIRITDDILENTSYYLEEVLAIKELINASIEEIPCLFVLDEIFKGTNTIERISGGKAILSYLNKGKCIVLVSTHDIELTDILNTEKFELYHFSEHITNGKLLFDHQLKIGRLKTRNALKILELYKYPSEIIDDARKVEQSFIPKVDTNSYT